MKTTNKLVYEFHVPLSIFYFHFVTQLCFLQVLSHILSSSYEINWQILCSLSFSVVFSVPSAVKTNDTHDYLYIKKEKKS